MRAWRGLLLTTGLALLGGAAIAALLLTRPTVMFSNQYGPQLCYAVVESIDSANDGRMPDTDPDVGFTSGESSGLAIQCERVRDRRLAGVALLAAPTWSAGLAAWRRRGVAVRAWMA